MAGLPEWKSLLDERADRKWDSFSWLTGRALISSLNHALNDVVPRLVPDLRGHWGTVDGDWDSGTRIVDRTGESRWLVVGDTGEQDASQYVVAPALTAMSDQADFMVILSDVIYPSGDVNDYRDGYYVPYETFDKPILAIPGNHDWYDGLAGFMWHFCHAERLPKSAYVNPEATLNERFMRRFWRRPSRERDREDLEQRRAARASAPLQPGSYYVIDTKHVRLVCIDTGIDGKLDKTQGDWLRARAVEPGKKVLLTGKPLMVNNELDEGEIEGGGSVNEIVTAPGNGFVAAIGGDIHNFQHYGAQVGGRPFHYVVSGGGGAFMSATHTIRPAKQGSLNADVLYPSQVACLQHFAKLVVPGVWRLVRIVLAALLGMAVAAALVAIAEDHLGFGGGRDWIPGLTIDADLLRAGLRGAAILLGAGVLLRIALLSDHTRTRGYRAYLVAGAFLAGVVLVGAGWWLAPERFDENLLAWVGLTAGGALLAWLMRRTHWWRRPAPGYTIRPISVLAAAAVLAAVPVLAWFASEDIVLTATGCVVAAVGIVGWFLRRSAWWNTAAAIAAMGVQFLAALVVLQRVVVPASARDPYEAAAIALVVLLVSLATVVKFAPAGLVAVLAGVLVAVFVLDGDTQRAALLAPLGVLGLPLIAGGVDALRRASPRYYKPLALLLAGALAVGAWFIGDWFLPALAAVAVIVAVTLLAIAFIHLMFLGALALVWHPGEHTEQEFLSDPEAEAVLEWRHGATRPRLTPRVRRIANIVYPGAANPHGPIQRFVAEIFDSNDPPFFKNFLHMYTTEEELTIVVHAVTGEGEELSIELATCTIPLGSGS
jgi:hypothetical protein